MNTTLPLYRLFGRSLWNETRMLVVSIVCLLGIIPIPIANAANWTTDANLSVSEIYTDNVRLSETGSTDDLITELSPSIGIMGNGARIDLNFDYSLNFLNYKENGDLNDVRHRLNFDSDFELVPDYWSAHAHSAITQQVTSTKRQGSGSIVGSSNVVDTFQNRLSSAWNSKLGSAALFELGLSIDQVDYIANSNSGTSSSNQLDSVGYQSRATLTNGNSLHRAFWRANFNDRRVEYENDEQAGTEDGTVTVGYRWEIFSISLDGGWQRYKHRTATASPQPDSEFTAANLIWHPSKKLSFTLSSTNRNYEQTLVDSSAKDQSLGSAITWNPNVRTSLSASTGNNFYGDSYNFSFFHKSRKSSLTASYGESITNLRDSLFFRVPGFKVCPAGVVTGCRYEPLNSTNISANESYTLGVFLAVSDQDYLNKQGSIGYSHQAAKNNLSISLFQSDRIFLGSNLEERDKGIRLGWTWRFGRVSSMAFTASRTQRQFQDSTEGDFSSLNLDITGQLGRKTSWSVIVHGAENVNNSITDSYEESHIRFQLSTSLN